jgi:hypothetical protein
VAIQQPRRFADPRWPFEFSYPAGWFIHVTGAELVLRSPDPQDMLADNELQCEHGSGLPSVPDARSESQRFQGSFYLDHSGWKVQMGPGFCERENCESPKTRMMGPATFMSAEVAYRTGNVWGYGGMGDAREYLVIEGSEWAHCFDRLLDSEDRIQPRTRQRAR